MTERFLRMSAWLVAQAVMVSITRQVTSRIAAGDKRGLIVAGVMTVAGSGCKDRYHSTPTADRVQDGFSGKLCLFTLIQVMFVNPFALCNMCLSFRKRDVR